MVRNSQQRREEGAAQSVLYLSAILAELKRIRELLEDKQKIRVEIMAENIKKAQLAALEPWGRKESAWSSADQGAGIPQPAPTQNYSDQNNNGDWRKLLEEIEGL